MDATTLNDSMPLAAMTIGQARQFISGLISEGLGAKPIPASVLRSDIMDIDNAISFLHEIGCFVSKNALYNMTASGRIPCRRIGKRLSFSRNELEIWVQDNTTQRKTVTDAANTSLIIAKSARRKK